MMRVNITGREKYNVVWSETRKHAGGTVRFDETTTIVRGETKRNSALSGAVADGHDFSFVYTLCSRFVIRHDVCTRGRRRGTAVPDGFRSPPRGKTIVRSRGGAYGVHNMTYTLYGVRVHKRCYNMRSPTVSVSRGVERTRTTVRSIRSRAAKPFFFFFLVVLYTRTSALSYGNDSRRTGGGGAVRIITYRNGDIEYDGKPVAV